MKREVVQWTIRDICEKRGQISFPEYQREPLLWTKEDMRLLIDSILTDIDIPKLYFYEVQKDEYEVIDGQQRLWAIWRFIDNEYDFQLNGSRRKFNELDRSLQDKILSYKLQITLIAGAKEEYLRNLFLRLQLGLPLVTGEKLKAKTGTMRNFIFKEMVEHPFVNVINIPRRRYGKQTLCAQICINSFSRKKGGEFSGTRFNDLKYFFDDYSNPKGSDLEFFNNNCKFIIRVLDILDSHFKKDAACILKNRSFILSVYLYAEKLVENSGRGEINKIMPVFATFVVKLWKRLKDEAKLGINRENEKLYKFESYLSNAPGEKYQVSNREQALEEFFEYFLKTGKIKGDK